jgi:lipopolysaccharide/colanic/teichoic acid biosynthesis glycosyltransferase
MSLVGPRPQVPRFVDCFEPSLRRIVLHVRPGITGPTALHFRHEETLLADKVDRENFYIEQILPVKLQMDAEYVRNRSLRNDLRILTQTAWMFSGAHVQHALRFGGTRKHHGSVQLERMTPDRETPTTDRTQEDIIGIAQR